MKRLLPTFWSLLAPSTLALASACGSSSPACDGGLHDPDAPLEASDAAVLPCSEVRVVNLVAGSQTVTGDTTGRSAEGQAFYCGDGPSPYELVALTLPGDASDTVLVHYALDPEVTMHQAVLELRPHGCADRTDSECRSWYGLDPANPPEGNLVAPGGSVAYLYVSGADPDAFGPWAIDFEVDASLAVPVLTAGTVTRVGMDRFEATFDGSDADGDVITLGMRLFDASGALITLHPAEIDVSEFTFYFNSVFLGTAFGGRGYIGNEGWAISGLLEQTASAVRAELVLRDARNLVSEPLMVDIVDATSAELGEPCGPTAVCTPSLACSAGTCAPPSICASATPLTLVPGVTTTRTVTLGPGFGALDRPCNYTGGTEAVFSIDVPTASAGVFGYELLVGGVTDMGTAQFHLQTACGVPDAYEVAWCGYQGSDQAVSMTPGPRFLVIEHPDGNNDPLTFDVPITLRPILDEGQPCDPMGLLSRCAVGVCPDMPSPVCPESCNVFNVGECGPGRACGAWAYPSANGLCVEAGSSALGAPCTDAPGISGCVDGLSCQGVCVTYCDATHDCPSGICPAFLGDVATCFP
jgi:hypothetical protein